MILNVRSGFIHQLGTVFFFLLRIRTWPLYDLLVEDIKTHSFSRQQWLTEIQVTLTGCRSTGA